MNKTQPTKASVDAFLSSVEPEQKRIDAQHLDQLFQRVTGYQPVMWGTLIIGYGKYHYRYESGREGDFLATGFSPRKANFAVYIMPGYTDFGYILQRLGKFKLGKSCLYFNKLADLDLEVLSTLVKAGLEDLDTRWPVRPV